MKNILIQFIERMETMNLREQDQTIESAMKDMAEVIREHTIPDYVVLTNKQRCYLGNECDPYNDVCSCG